MVNSLIMIRYRISYKACPTLGMAVRAFSESFDEGGKDRSWLWTIPFRGLGMEWHKKEVSKMLIFLPLSCDCYTVTNCPGSCGHVFPILLDHIFPVIMIMSSPSGWTISSRFLWPYLPILLGRVFFMVDTKINASSFKLIFVLSFVT